MATEVMSVRVDSDEFAAFRVTCKERGVEYSDTVRELITAYNDNRIKITPTDSQKEHLEIYK